MMYLSEDGNVNKAVPHNQSDHDERDEIPATDVDWDKNNKDAMTEAAEHLKEFEKDGTVISDDQLDNERHRENITDHLDTAIDAAESGMHIEDFPGINPDEGNENATE